MRHENRAWFRTVGIATVMGKLVVLKFGEGSFEQGFAVTLEIGEEQGRATTEITGKLPSFPEMPLYYSHWQSSYRQIGNRYRLHADKNAGDECLDDSRLRKRFSYFAGPL